MALEQVCLEGYQCLEPANPVQCDKGTYNDFKNQTKERSAKNCIIAKQQVKHERLK